MDNYTNIYMSITASRAYISRNSLNICQSEKYLIKVYRKNETYFMSAKLLLQIYSSRDKTGERRPQNCNVVHTFPNLD
jgi:hypothetical protein